MILVTGAAGVCGSILRKAMLKAVYTDIVEFELENQVSQKKIGDLADDVFCDDVLEGVDTIVHLGGMSDPQTNWGKVLDANIIGTSNLFVKAAEKGINKIIFASTNHVVGQIELDNMPDIYVEGAGIIADSDYPACPDSYYGVSKSFGESLLSYLCHLHGFSGISLRIGAVLPPDEDSDDAYAIRYRHNHGCIDENKELELYNRLSCLRVSNQRWVDSISKLVESKWHGYKVKNMTGTGYSWLKNEMI